MSSYYCKITIEIYQAKGHNNSPQPGCVLGPLGIVDSQEFTMREKQPKLHSKTEKQANRKWERMPGLLFAPVQNLRPRGVCQETKNEEEEKGTIDPL